MQGNVIGLDATGVKLDSYFPDEVTRLKLLGRPNQPLRSVTFIILI